MEENCPAEVTHLGLLGAITRIEERQSMQVERGSERTQTVWTINGHTAQTTVRWEPQRVPAFSAYYFVHHTPDVIEGEVQGRFETLEAAQQAALNAIFAVIGGIETGGATLTDS